MKKSTIFIFISLITILQIIILLSLYKFFAKGLANYLGGGLLLTILMIFHIVRNSLKNDVKLSWIFLVVISPIFGTIFYWYVYFDFGHRIMKKRINDIIEMTNNLLECDLKESGMLNYMRLTNPTNAYKNNRVEYFKSGLEKWESMLEELKKAENFIFLEYFIIEHGIMWDSILEILKEKVKNNVEVLLLYDGTCELTTLSLKYYKKLNEYGIKAKAFAPIKPFISTHYNYRDHRKLLIIDGKVAFNGGINLADEYINKKEVFGHWKDVGIKIEGDAVNTFSLLFLQMWNADEKNIDIENNFKKYLNIEIEEIKDEGYVIPYGDNPLDYYKVGERVYLEIINKAKDYIYIMTPYLILDEEILYALKFAAEKKIDVRIILPGIPDKKIPYSLAKTHYKNLINSGVKIYEYKKGFVHAKTFLSDDIKAVVGTINLDYRSLYHHFECATYLYNKACIKDIKEDFYETFEKSHLITIEDIKNEKILYKIMGYFFKILAPLM